MARPSRRGRGAKRRTPAPEPVDRRVRFDALGRHGDGLGDVDGKRVYVPMALPGEVAEVRLRGERGELLRVAEPSPDRVTAPCPHFGTCGGCAVQHLAAPAYENWKAGLLETALRRRGIDTPVDPLTYAHGEGRRRATLHARRAKGGWRVGFMEARSHRVLVFDSCAVLSPALAGVGQWVPDLLTPLSGEVDLLVTAAENGLDVDIRGGGDLSYDLQVALAETADRFDLARVSLDGDIVVERRRPVLTMGRARLTPAPGGFLQATAAGEAALSERVLAAMEGAGSVADLFSGVGPFALRLAGTASVHAVDSDGTALQALDDAGRHTQGLKPLTTEVRNLAGRPLVPGELNSYDAVVFDPPRSGAEAQARELAQSTVATVVAVSCDPATFARDAAILIEGGYALERVTPLDQFKYAAHVEIIGVFQR